MQQPERTAEHQWLKKFLGDWAYDARCPTGHGDEQFELKGTEHVRAIGGGWIHAKGRATMPDGSPMVTINLIGYNPATGRFVGSWIGSMMHHMFVYDGWIEEDGRTLVLETTGPGISDPSRQCRYRDITEFVGPDHRAFRTEILDDEGNWTKFMSLDLRRARQ